ncbi:unnamed protein product [Trifolium pratense]|uniref:Uncharacterized protein n=1 Tax=Trifolium pratense TaxID=57577 RepID=A0ACB0LJR6_TRIPR|nr:unnamed protein product [Trifolium pratense]
MDYPGFGLSEGIHCYIPSFDSLVADVIEIYSKIKGTLNDVIEIRMLKLNIANLIVRKGSIIVYDSSMSTLNVQGMRLPIPPRGVMVKI